MLGSGDDVLKKAEDMLGMFESLLNGDIGFTGFVKPPKIIMESIMMKLKEF